MLLIHEDKLPVDHKKFGVIAQSDHLWFLLTSPASAEPANNMKQ